MYGAFSGISFGLVALVALLVIALAFFASPLIAVIIFVVAALFLLIGMSALRQRSRHQDETQGGAPDTHAPGPGRAAGRHPGGEPASGEG
jgi:membrane protein implicated in regulation of membrane protease activity